MKARKLPVEIEFYQTRSKRIHSATYNDMIIKWVSWEVYPCKKDIFEKTYEII